MLLVSEHYEPSTGATAQLMSDLTNDLVALNWRVTVLTATPGPQSATKARPMVVRLNKTRSGQEVVNVFSKAVRGTSFLISSLKWCLLHSRQDDVILIVSNPPFIGLLGPLVNILKGLPYIFVFQDLFPQTAVVSGLLTASSPITNICQWLMDYICKKAAKIVVLSNSMKTKLEQHVNQINTITVIHNWAIEQALPIPISNNPFAIQHDFQHLFTIQYSGNFGRLHDLNTLLDAAVIIRERPVQFVFIGGGAKQALIDKYCKSHSLKNVLQLNYQPRDVLPYSLGACDLSTVALIPGAENNMAPCKFYGILASGKGILLIAKKNCDLAQLVLTEKIGVVIEPGESEALAENLLKLSKNPEDVQAMGMRARSLYKERFGRKRSTLAYAALLQSIQ